jgi:hypothetical protein
MNTEKSALALSPIVLRGKFLTGCVKTMVVGENFDGYCQLAEEAEIR